MSNAKAAPIPEDLKVMCPSCLGTGIRARGNFSDPETFHVVTCTVCKGTRKVWALDQQEMADRIATLTAEVAALKAKIARLSAPVTDDDVNCLAIMLTAMHEGVQAPSRAEIAAAMTALILERATPPQAGGKE